MKFNLNLDKPLRSLDEIYAKAQDKVKQHGPYRVVEAVAEDTLTLKGLALGRQNGLIEPILVGHKRHISETLKHIGEKLSNWKIIVEEDHHLATLKAIKLIQDNKADILMRGKLLARDFFKALFEPSLGLRKPGSLWTNIVVLSVNGIDRLLFLTDCALVVDAELTERLKLIQNATEFAYEFGVKEPKIALLAAVETVTPGMPVALEEAIIAKMSERGQFPKGVSVDCPLSFDLAINPKAVEKKKMKSPVAGQADILVVNNIHVGNVLFKSLITLCGASSASVIVGAPFPIILTSRSENPQNILYSFALSILMMG